VKHEFIFQRILLKYTFGKAQRGLRTPNASRAFKYVLANVVAKYTLMINSLAKSYPEIREAFGVRSPCCAFPRMYLIRIH